MADVYLLRATAAVETLPFCVALRLPALESASAACPRTCAGARRIISEQALDDHGGALRFVQRLESGEFKMVICMTGTGIAFLRDAVSAHMAVERLGAALRRAAIVSREPKPVGILRALGVPVDVMIPEPNTWREIVEGWGPW